MNSCHDDHCTVKTFAHFFYKNIMNFTLACKFLRTTEFCGLLNFFNYSKFSPLTKITLFKNWFTLLLKKLKNCFTLWAKPYLLVGIPNTFSSNFFFCHLTFSSINKYCLSAARWYSLDFFSSLVIIAHLFSVDNNCMSFPAVAFAITSAKLVVPGINPILSISCVNKLSRKHNNVAVNLFFLSDGCGCIYTVCQA